MTGLDLESFLRLLQTESAVWWNLAAFALFLGLLAWASRAKRRALQRCLLISLAVHAGIVVYAGPPTSQWLLSSLTRDKAVANTERLSHVQVIAGDALGPTLDSKTDDLEDPSNQTKDLRQAGPLADLDRPVTTLALTEPTLQNGDLVPRAPAPVASKHDKSDAPELAVRVDIPIPNRLQPDVRDREPTSSDMEDSLAKGTSPLLDSEQAPVRIAGSRATDSNRSSLLTMPDLEASQGRGDSNPKANRMPAKRIREPSSASDSNVIGGLLPPSDRSNTTSPSVSDRLAMEGASSLVTNSAPLAMDESPSTTAEKMRNLKQAVSTGDAQLAVPDDEKPRSSQGAPSGVVPRAPSASLAMRSPPAAPRSNPIPLVGESIGRDVSSMALPGRVGDRDSRPLPEIPEVYRSRLAPNRSALAFTSGATPASEEAVERALAWLERHQDADGRWNAASRGDLSFTAHCPPDAVCDGECIYTEADTAMTGLALLAYLGAGHTHKQSPYARTIALGLNFLVASQKEDGDLRGGAVSFGMYCHCMATLAMSEAFALTGDERLREPVERAVAFLLRSRAADLQSWRYEPGDRMGGDTSVLGWAVMVLKSAKEVGVIVPEDVRLGAVAWLRRVSDGRDGGLAMYRPGNLDPRYGGRVTPTMTAEAWVCRQFLGVGGPGPASDEAAAYLLQHGPDRDPYNLYYWYYATLALFQQGGEPWVRWNARVRDQLVQRQIRGGHADGSWDPKHCKDKYDSTGGRIYATVMATMTLEVYYRYLRLYDSPATPEPPAAPDAALRRTGLDANDATDPRTPVPDTP